MSLHIVVFHKLHSQRLCSVITCFDTSDQFVGSRRRLEYSGTEQKERKSCGNTPPNPRRSPPDTQRPQHTLKFKTGSRRETWRRLRRGRKRGQTPISANNHVTSHVSGEKGGYSGFLGALTGRPGVSPFFDAHRESVFQRIADWRRRPRTPRGCSPKRV